ncbi:MAG: D-glycero-beta-D-manno-heptose-7-phosphate kinase [Chloroflexota bacterium]|nr:MAG: D-glycero-beta-D-manno-heptose-7-phosphate kinase [Chloroflexota bacterium]
MVSEIQGDLSNMLSLFTNRRVLVVGDLMLDEWIWGNVSRISPEAPIPVVQVQSISRTPGGACNVAANIASLSGQAILLGVIGQDEAGEHLREELEKLNIDATDLFVDPQRPTTLKTRIVAHSQQVVRADRESRLPISTELAKCLAARLNDRIDGVEAVLISDYGKGVTTPPLVQQIIRAATERGKPVIIDPKGFSYAKYRGSTVITPNKLEVAQAVGVELTDQDSVLRAGKTLLRDLACRVALITRGEEGMSLIQDSGEVWHFPANARQVYDVTGAGDTVVASFALALASGGNYVQSAYVANHAAGVVVAKVGTATVSLDELRRSMAGCDARAFRVE